jgi:hypothetical protein
MRSEAQHCALAGKVSDRKFAAALANSFVLMSLLFGPSLA